MRSEVQLFVFPFLKAALSLRPPSRVRPAPCGLGVLAGEKWGYVPHCIPSKGVRGLPPLPPHHRGALQGLLGEKGEAGRAAAASLSSCTGAAEPRARGRSSSPPGCADGLARPVLRARASRGAQSARNLRESPRGGAVPAGGLTRGAEQKDRSLYPAPGSEAGTAFCPAAPALKIPRSWPRGAAKKRASATCPRWHPPRATSEAAGGGGRPRAERAQRFRTGALRPRVPAPSSSRPAPRAAPRAPRSGSARDFRFQSRGLAVFKSRALTPVPTDSRHLTGPLENPETRQHPWGWELARLGAGGWRGGNRGAAQPSLPHGAITPADT